MKRGGGGGRSDILETLAQESFDILTLLPTYIENTKDAIADMSEESKRRYTLLRDTAEISIFSPLLRHTDKLQTNRHTMISPGF